MLANNQNYNINAHLNSNWHAALFLRFSSRAGKTILIKRSHEGPLMVQRAFYPENNGVCHIYLLHPPGAYVGGDHLQVKIDLERDSKVLITTPAAAKCYRCPGEKVVIVQKLTLAENACLEWLPQESIAFNGARLDTATHINLMANSVFVGWDIICLGRPAVAEGFLSGYWSSRLVLHRDEQLIFHEKSLFEGAGDILKQNWGLAGFPVSGTFICTVYNLEIVDVVRKVINNLNDEYFSITQLPKVIVCRYLGHHAERAREIFTNAWSIIRPTLTGIKVTIPRIWGT